MEIYGLSPYAVHQLLYFTLLRKEANFQGMTLYCLNHYQKRFIDGALCVVPRNFYLSIWKILRRSPNGMLVEKESIPQLPTLDVMTADEINFKFYIEVVISSVEEPVRRRLVMEMIGVIATMVERNPEVIFRDCLNIGSLIDNAKQLFETKNIQTPSLVETCEKSDSLKLLSRVDRFEYLSPSLERGSIFYMTQAVINLLVSESRIKDDMNSNCVIS
ncbi:Phosphorylase b kinase regulatory subunit beta [Thelohanellus kitauei]|uniref:Phosphorylase b kinase regulatory subunit n=1 Tax=Thelohanellus kitauei TaxID=669202 RepID=A0A0C2J6C0_THEKT|nr:Phosphorylase b kinase regulatory subunit beta [Thelohanellus kitauei]